MKSKLSNLAKEVLTEACWDGYKQIGMKKKGDRQVPNCVPIKESEQELDEISLMTGDADQATSLELLNEFVDMDDKFEKLLIRLYDREQVTTWRSDDKWYNDPMVRDAPADARIREYIKSKAKESQGQLYVLITPSDRGSRTVHHLINLAEPVRTMYVGKIETEPSTGPYSMKTMFGIDSQVVHWSNFAQEYKGYGYGKFLYDTLLYRYGTLESDSTLYQGSQRMWMGHMPKVAKFFGGVVKNPEGWGGGSQSEYPTLVVPLTAEDVADKAFIRDDIGSLVAFHSSIPTQVKKVAALSKGLSYRNGSLGIAFYELSIKDKIDDREERGNRYNDDGERQSEDETFIEWLDSEQGQTSYEEIITALYDLYDMSSKIDFDKAKVVFVVAQDATVIITKKGSSYDYALL